MLYLIPGFQHSCRDEQYVRLISALKELNVPVSPVGINWKRTTIEEWIEEAESQIGSLTAADSMLGFSCGAMIALQVARTTPMRALFLCSLSPYYAEYLETLPES